MPNNPSQSDIDAVLAGYDAQKVDEATGASQESIDLVLRQHDANQAELESRGLETVAISAGSALTGGLLEQILAKTSINGQPLYDAGELEAMREQHRGKALGAEIAAALTPLGFAGAATTAGKVTAKQVHRMMGNSINKSLARKLAERAVPVAAEAAAEGSLWGLQHAVSEDAIGRADLNAESVITNMGMGAVMGGAVGGLMGTASALQKIRTKTGAAAKAATKAGEATSDDAGKGLLQRLDEWYSQDTVKPPKNLEEKRAIAKELDVVLTAGETTSSPTIRRLESSLAESPTPMGSIVRRRLTENLSKYEKHAEDFIKEVTDESKTVIGDRAKQVFLREMDNIADPISDMYEKLKFNTRAIELEEGTIEYAKSQVQGLMNEASTGGDVHAFYSSILERLDGQRNLSQLKGMMSEVKGTANQHYRGGNWAMQHAATSVDDILSGAFDDGIEIALGKSGDTTLAASFKASKRKADRLWSQFKRDMGELGQDLKIGNIKSRSQLRYKLNKIESTTLVERMFTTKNVAVAHRLKNRFPEVFDDVIQLKITELRNAAMKVNPKSGEKYFDFKAFYNNFNKLEPEIQKLIYTAPELDKMNKLYKLLESFPPNFNPSGTAFENRIQNMLGIKAFISDAGRYLVWSRAEKKARGEVISKLAADKAATDNLILAAAKSVNRKVGAVAASRTPVLAVVAALNTNLVTGKKEKSKPAPLAAMDRIKDIQNLTENPDQLLDKTADLYEMAPATSTQIGTSIARGLQFLQMKASEVPAKTAANGRVFPPSEIAAKRFGRYIDAVYNPKNALANIAAGTVSPEEIEVLKNVYPSLWGELTAKVTEHVMENEGKANYKNKLLIGHILDIPYVEEAKPDMVASLQANFAPAQDVAQMQQVGSGGQASKPRQTNMKSIGTMQSGTEAIATRK